MYSWFCPLRGIVLFGLAALAAVSAFGVDLKIYTSGPQNTFGFGPQMDATMKVSSAREITIDGLTGCDVTYGVGSDLGRTRVAVFYHGGKRYTIMAAGFDNGPGEYDTYAQAIDAVVKSFRLVR